MAGHSKWSKITRLKAVLDSRKGKVFAKLARELTVAAKLGGGDPGMNPRLRTVLLKCRGANMPADNVERAIAKGVGGGEGTSFDDLTYEIYAPHGVAILAELSTDNRNRTAAEIRSLVTKAGGNIATAGSVSRLFQRRGQFIVPRDAASEDRLMELALEAGAEDFKAEPEGYEILTEPTQFETLNQALERGGIKCEVAEVVALPSLTVPLADPEQVAVVAGLLEGLEDHDDVKELFSNADFQTEAS